MSAILDSIRKRFLLCLEEVRTENKLMRSNIELAKKLRTQPPRISEWEKGIGNPTVEHIFYLCKEFGKSPAFIILGEKQKAKEEVTFGLHDVLRRVERLEKKIDKKPLGKTG